jgi:hypothetical protein
VAIRDHQILRQGNNILLGIALDDAVLDIETTAQQLRECLKVLQESNQALLRPVLGNFGIYPIAVNVDDNTVSIFVDGPDFVQSRNQSAAIWLDKEDLRRLLVEALQTGS